MRIYLMDEAPRIGSGMRDVEVVSTGPKWTTVKYAPLSVKVRGSRKKRNPIYTVNHKFPAAIWDEIAKHSEENYA
jgi:hypothetical protein